MQQTFDHPNNSPPYQIRLRSDKADRVCGVERDPASLAFGLVVVPHVLLWKRPDGGLTKENLSGALNHGDEVDVIRTVQRDGNFWCFVEARVIADGRTHLQRGWVSERMLETAGKKYYEGVESVVQ